MADINIITAAYEALIREQQVQLQHKSLKIKEQSDLLESGKRKVTNSINLTKEQIDEILIAFEPTSNREN